MEAKRKTTDLRERLSALSEFSSEDASVVVFGSVGRGEVTDASDVDWTLLVDGPADPQPRSPGDPGFVSVSGSWDSRAKSGWKLETPVTSSEMVWKVCF